MGWGRALRRSVLTLLGAAVLISGTGIAVLAYPQPLFPYEARVGRLTLHSDRPFDAGAAERLLTEVERRIPLSPLDIPARTHDVFIANADWRRRLTFLWAYGAAGVNYYPIRNVFIRRADVSAGIVFRNDGTPVPAPRTLAYYAAHEIGHSMIGERVGALANQRLPAWIREGLADYIGLAGDIDIESLTADLRAGRRELDPQASGLYARYRLLVAYMLEREHWSVDRLLQSGLPQSDAERMLLAGVRD